MRKISITVYMCCPQKYTILPVIETETDLQRVSEATVSVEEGNMLTLVFLPVVSCCLFGRDGHCNPLPVDWHLHHRTVTLKLVT